MKHVVYTSAPATRPTPEGSLINDHFWTEQALIGSRLDWTILRDHLYTDLLLMGLPHAVATGQLFTATGGGRAQLRDARGLRADGRCRSAQGHRQAGAGRHRPAPVTQDEIAAIVSEVAGKTVTHIAVSPDDLRKGLAGAGLPPFLVEALVAFDIDAARGYHAINAPTVQELTGRAPTSVRAFLERASRGLAGRALNWSHFLRRTGVHFG